jgi:hypothetical protein
MKDRALSKATADLRRALDAAVVDQYDALGVCYSTLVDRIINELPKDKEGVKLIPHEAFKTDPVRQVRGLIQAHGRSREGYCVTSVSRSSAYCVTLVSRSYAYCVTLVSRSWHAPGSVAR